jgi:predicted permease
MKWWQVRKRDADLERELHADLELEEEEQLERGLSMDEARYAARRAFGNTTLIKEQTRETWGLASYERLWQDIRFAVRAARRSPMLTFVVIGTLSLGMGLNAGVFSILKSMMLDPPTRKDPATFVQIYPRYEGWFAGAARLTAFNYEDFDALRTQTHSLKDIAGWDSIGITLDDLHRQEPGLLITCNYFNVFGMDQLVMGRLFASNDCEPGTEERVIVIGEHLWRYSFAADPEIVGKVIHVSQQPFVVIGIIADSSTNLAPGDIWIPYTLQPAFNHSDNAFTDPNLPWLNVGARISQGHTRADAKNETETILRRRDQIYLVQKKFTLDRKTSVVIANGSFIANPALQTLGVAMMALVMGPLLLVLLLACTNVTMLFLSRYIARRGEIAVRLALGAGRARLTRMLLLESLLMSLLAGAISFWLARRIPVLLLASLDPGAQLAPLAIRPDWKAFGYLVVLILVSATVSALAPMRESFRFDLVSALKGREGASTMRTGTTTLLIVVQIAMSFVLLTAAVMFVRLPSTIENIDPGFETHHVMTVPIAIDIPPYTKTSELNFYRTLEARVLALPGVQSLAYASIPPFSLAAQREIRRDDEVRGQGRAASIDDVSPGFFSTFSITLVRGRPFVQSDEPTSGNSRVAVVSQAFAQAFWGTGDPVGKVIVTPDDRHLVVIGVATDTRSERYGVLDEPRLYTLRPSDSVGGQLFVRFNGSSALIVNGIEQAVKALDPTQVTTPSTIWATLEASATVMRTVAKVVLFMGGIAVALAIAGVYAVLTFVVSRRTRELGIQMMLGATRKRIFGALIKKGLQQIVLGLVGGMLLAFPATLTFARMTRKSMIPIHPFDVTVYIISALILLVISFCAISIPGFRATKVDPMNALRSE